MSEKRTMRLLMACAIGTLAGMVLTLSTTSWLCMVLRVPGGGAFNVGTQRNQSPPLCDVDSIFCASIVGLQLTKQKHRN
jgi:hypothetical protein